MKVFTVTIVSWHYGEEYEWTLIFSSLEKVNEWKNSYKIQNPDIDGGYACVREVEVDTNEIISEVEVFELDQKESYQ